MATKRELLQLGSAALTNFSADANTAFVNALSEYLGLDEKATIRDIRACEPQAFAIIEEVLDEHVPAALEAQIGMIAEVKTFARDAQPKFTIKGLGKNRVAYGIQPGARGGIYKARKLDSRDLVVSPKVQTVAYMITLEEILSGSTSLTDLVAAIAKGFVDSIFIEVVSMLRATYAKLPENNKAEGTGFVATGLDKVIRTVSAYGTPTVMVFRSEADKISNISAVASNPNVSGADLEDIRNNGFVQMYKGNKLVVIPNYFVDETNSKFVFKENDIFVIPSDEKPIKVAMMGETYIAEVAQPHGGKEWHAHRIIGTSMLFFNSIGIYRDTEEDSIPGLY